jgi:hypothetical protein
VCDLPGRYAGGDLIQQFAGDVEWAAVRSPGFGEQDGEPVRGGCIEHAKHFPDAFPGEERLKLLLGQQQGRLNADGPDVNPKANGHCCMSPGRHLPYQPPVLKHEHPKRHPAGQPPATRR